MKIPIFGLDSIVPHLSTSQHRDSMRLACCHPSHLGSLFPHVSTTVLVMLILLATLVYIVGWRIQWNPWPPSKFLGPAEDSWQAKSLTYVTYVTWKLLVCCWYAVGMLLVCCWYAVGMTGSLPSAQLFLDPSQRFIRVAFFADMRRLDGSVATEHADKRSWQEHFCIFLHDNRFISIHTSSLYAILCLTDFAISSSMISLAVISLEALQRYSNDHHLDFKHWTELRCSQDEKTPEISARLVISEVSQCAAGRTYGKHSTPGAGSPF